MKSIKLTEIELFEMVIYLSKPFTMKMFSSCCELKNNWIRPMEVTPPMAEQEQGLF